MINRTFEKSAALGRAVELLKQDEASFKTLVEKAYVEAKYARMLLKHLHEEKKVRVCRWERAHIGKPIPVYKWGSGKDAAKPIPYSKSERGKRYRAKLKDEYGEYYKHVLYAQNDPTPGMRLIVDGKVIWEKRK